MSQRGGEVESGLRLSDSVIFSDLLSSGSADMILSMEPMDVRELVIPDKVAEEVARKKAAAKAKASEYMEKGKKQLNRVADALEKLDETGSDGADKSK